MGSAQLTTFTVATNDYRSAGNERTEYHACVAWDRLAEICGQFLSKGQVAIAISLALQVVVVHVPVLNEAFSTAPLAIGDWLLCAATASSVLWFEEIRKLVARR
jgi:hypothetical protein